MSRAQKPVEAVETGVASSKTVHVIDDDDFLRSVMQYILEAEGYRVVAHPSARSFLEALESGARGCVVTDVRMPGMSGIELLQHITERAVSVPIILVTGHADVQLAVQAMKLGAVDLLEKPFGFDDLISTVRAALAGGVSPEGPEDNSSSGALASLSRRESQVLRGLVAGQTNKAIAASIGVSTRTVEVHRANVMRKTGAKSLPGLVRIALGEPGFANL